ITRMRCAAMRLVPPAVSSRVMRLSPAAENRTVGFGSKLNSPTIELPPTTPRRTRRGTPLPPPGAPMRGKPVVRTIALALISACGGCALPGGAERTVVVPRSHGTEGIIARTLSEAGSSVALLDIDLRTPGISVKVAAEPQRRGTSLAGEARTV